MRKNDVLIKGTKEGILVALGEGDDYLALKRRLEERLGSFARFFTGTEVTLEVGARHLTPSQLRELEEIITREHGMRVLRVRPARDAVDGDLLERVPVEERATGVVKRTLRSGQRAGYDGNMVLFGDVHPGAEVVASGDVVVLGSLLGVAHAGARGAEDAVVAALRLRPTQIRIGRHIGRPPEDEPAGGEDPEIARVRDGQIVVERYTAMSLMAHAERRETAWAKSS